MATFLHFTPCEQRSAISISHRNSSRPHTHTQRLAGWWLSLMFTCAMTKLQRHTLPLTRTLARMTIIAQSGEAVRAFDWLVNCSAMLQIARRDSWYYLIVVIAAETLHASILPCLFSVCVSLQITIAKFAKKTTMACKYWETYTQTKSILHRMIKTHLK